MTDHLVDRNGLIEAHRRLRAQLTPPPGKPMTVPIREIHATIDQREQLLALVEEYVQAKRNLLLLDHGDQIALAAQLADLAPVRAVERRSFAVVLLDEYQDTNVAQRILLQRLFGDGHPVTAVGDPAQSIYGFRGASVSNIVRFPEQFPRASGAPARSSDLRAQVSGPARVRRFVARPASSTHAVSVVGGAALVFGGAAGAASAMRAAAARGANAACTSSILS